MNNDKLVKALGRDTVEEMDTYREEDLKRTIVEASSAMSAAKEELDGNIDYQKAKADVSLLSSGKREVDKRQKAKIAYSLSRLSELGSMQASDRLTWERLRTDKVKEVEARKAAKAKEAEAQAPSPVRHLKDIKVTMSLNGGKSVDATALINRQTKELLDEASES